MAEETIVEAVPIEDEDVVALVAADRASVDVQVATARRYPRSVVAFKRAALAMATLDEDTAASMFYSIPRAGKNIEGPSVRLAEVVAVCWGNLRCRARMADEGPTTVTAVGEAWDLQSNYAQSIEVSRKILDRNGKRYNEDMINTTKQASLSIAKRTAIFAVVPMTYVKPIWQESQQVSVGKALTMDQRRQKVIDWYSKLGIKEEDVYKIIRIKGSEDLTMENVITLRGYATAIKEGELSLDELRRLAQGVVEVEPSGLKPSDVAAGKAEGKDDQQGKDASKDATPKK